MVLEEESFIRRSVRQDFGSFPEDRERNLFSRRLGQLRRDAPESEGQCMPVYGGRLVTAGDWLVFRGLTTVGSTPFPGVDTRMNAVSRTGVLDVGTESYRWRE